jgi:CRP-like cAMP-binding protein
MEKRTYRSGDVIYERGQHSSEFFVLRKGKVWFLLKEEAIEQKDITLINKDNPSKEGYCSIFVDPDLKRSSNENMFGKEMVNCLEIERKRTN